MRKKWIVLLLVTLFSAVMLAGCGHNHTWTPANCIAPKTCSVCGEAQGEALGHTWAEATCAAPKTCAVCGAAEGEALGHTWAEAACAVPKTCTVCGATEGEALGHTWTAATCAVPKTCTVCGATEGEAIEHTWSLATCEAPEICSVCGAKEGDPLGHDAPELTCTADAVCARCGKTVTAPGHTVSDATCTEASVCSVCGEIAGEALGHAADNGVCSRCGMEIYATQSGSGDDVVSGIEVGDGLYRVHFVNTGKRNFIVKSYDASNDRELLINEIGKYDGYVYLSGPAPFAFEIQSSGKWSFTIERLAVASGESFSGKGDFVTDMFPVSSRTWQFTHDGRHNFIVRIYTTDGRSLLINEIGPYDGKKILDVPSGSGAFFEITADGNWTAAPVS